MEVDAGDDSDSEKRQRRSRARAETADDTPAVPPAQNATAEPTDALLEAEREKARKRAERFGLPYVEPTMPTAIMAEPAKHLTPEEVIAAKAAKRLEILKQRREKEAAKREGFYTGFDTLSAEEIKKKEERAAKYGLALMGVTKEDAERALHEKAEAEEAEAARKKREERFGVVERPEKKPDAAGMDIDCLERPVDPAPNAEVRPEVVHLYGCDTLSTADCMAYFQGYQPVFVEWINDSSCNVVFVDAFTAKRAMHGLGKKSLNPVPGAVQATGEVPEDRQWFSGPDFVKNGVSIKLSFRLATVLDAKVKKTKSRYLWLEGAPPPGLAIPAGAGRGKRRQRDAGAEGGDAMETDEAGGGGKRQRKRAQRKEPAAAAETGDGAAPAAAEQKGPTEDLRKAVLAAKSMLATGGRRLAMDALGGADDDSAVPDFGNDGP